MAVLGERVKSFFPLQASDNVIELFRSQLEGSEEPDLTLLSIVIGCVENLLTCNRALSGSSGVESATLEPSFPVVEIHTVEALYAKFKTQIKGSVDLTIYRNSRHATRELVKKVSDVIWGSLTRSYYKDRAHLQSLYSYLTGNKLDCFGVAFAVVAAFQILDYRDVHLALSEDHAWVIYGKDSEETAEVTWHGKGNEDKRGQPVTIDTTEKSWLYLNGYPVKCTRHMEVAALVSGINPSINATSDSIELASLQQKLLWLLYDLGHLKKYPMALGNLGDLEEISHSPGRPPPMDLFRESILSAQSFYNNQHVYPYTYLGGYLYRNGRYKKALEAWANSADVIRKFNYGREDEEIYKEFLEISNELIPHIIKVVSSSSSGCEPSSESSVPLLQDPLCFVHLLRFYDGLCEWEEGSSTPVLHIGWAKPLVSTISKFSGPVRAKVNISVPGSTLDGQTEVPLQVKPRERFSEKSRTKCKKEISAVNGSSEQCKSKSTDKDGSSNSTTNGKMEGKSVEGQETEFLRTLVTRINTDEAPHPNIMALAAACSDNILNPEYLLGSGEPFSHKSSSTTSAVSDAAEKTGSQTNGTPVLDHGADVSKTNRPVDLMQGDEMASVTLTSQKMKGLKDLLLAEKLNTSAIQLQLTAQSQVHVTKRGRLANEFDYVAGGRTTKRSRRD